MKYVGSSHSYRKWLLTQLPLRLDTNMIFGYLAFTYRCRGCVFKLFMCSYGSLEARQLNQIGLQLIHHNYRTGNLNLKFKIAVERHATLRLIACRFTIHLCQRGFWIPETMQAFCYIINVLLFKVAKISPNFVDIGCENLCNSVVA